MFNIKKIGIVLILISVGIFAFIFYSESQIKNIPIVFSSRDFLTMLWSNYKDQYIEKSTSRTLDKQQEYITTSEGESYTMFRSALVDDKTTFDASFKWTQTILKHKEDNLHSWLFGKHANGSYGVLSERGGQNSATDAESDIALSLIFAYEKWGDITYLTEANNIISDIWDKEVIMIQGKPVLVSNDIEKSLHKPTVIVNPSYFSPYAYRIFAILDKKHDWNGLVNNSYALLTQSAKLDLDTPTSTGLPPDWFEIDVSTGTIHRASSPNLTTNYSYDSLRIPWRIALDWQWNKNPQSKRLLDSFSFFSNKWNTDKKIVISYSHDGKVIRNIEAPAMYGGVIGYFLVSDPENAKKVYENRIQILYNPDTNSWKLPLGYYDDNWAWFGIALYNQFIPNIAQGLPLQATT